MPPRKRPRPSGSTAPPPPPPPPQFDPAMFQAAVTAAVAAAMSQIGPNGNGGSGSGATPSNQGSSGYTTSSGVRVGLDLNQDDELELEEIVRPLGRDKAKRKGKMTSSGASNFRMDVNEMRKITASFDRYNLNFSERLAFDKEKEETRKKERAERQEMDDMMFFY
ncbi:zinc finger CCCH domain-containing protein 14-like [Lactuca sativa]|uniref:zinc finger CCCH domain-containing protein 14-like n=1 Tax=Lactuca sativa TaxID=4236 RepID=UPI0022AFC1D9|nr:zinc finger CCCH domain-containing protein 14-like [Lactuca sativa]